FQPAIAKVVWQVGNLPHEPGHRLGSATSHHFLATKYLISGRVKYNMVVVTGGTQRCQEPFLTNRDKTNH
ncbi:MAG TPA: hypothetical protein VND64_11720, partial [Pirellulales bacterium]|nr:hypothetical protein [Pirellulales bacterium]